MNYAMILVNRYPGRLANLLVDYLRRSIRLLRNLFYTALVPVYYACRCDNRRSFGEVDLPGLDSGRFLR